MATKKAAGSTDLGRDSIAKRLGVKKADGQHVMAGQIVVRQRGTSIHPGVGMRRGSDDTLYASINGFVRFTKKMVHNFTGHLVRRTFVTVEEIRN